MSILEYADFISRIYSFTIFFCAIWNYYIYLYIYICLCFIFQQSECNNEISHQAVNKLVRQFKGKLSDQVNRNLRKLKTEIHKALDGEENYIVYLYISDELDDPIEFKNGNGVNELVIDIDENGIDFAWVKTSYWRKTKVFYEAAETKVTTSFWYVLEKMKSTAGYARNAISWKK